MTIGFWRRVLSMQRERGRQLSLSREEEKYDDDKSKRRAKSRHYKLVATVVSGWNVDQTPTLPCNNMCYVEASVGEGDFIYDMRRTDVIRPTSFDMRHYFWRQEFVFYFPRWYYGPEDDDDVVQVVQHVQFRVIRAQGKSDPAAGTSSRETVLGQARFELGIDRPNKELSGNLKLFTPAFDEHRNAIVPSVTGGILNVQLFFKAPSDHPTFRQPRHAASIHIA